MRVSILRTVAALGAFLLSSPVAYAHTISIGSFNAGSPGSVTLVMGTYSHGAGVVQGTMQLTAGPGGFMPSAIVNMGPLLTTKPSGLIDGNNNFFADCGSSSGCTSDPDSYSQSTNGTGQTTVNWQGATFSGLNAGLYTYALSGMTAANWNNWNSFDANWNGTLVISGTSVGVSGVPVPAAVWLFGTALIGFIGLSRRRKVA